MLFDGQMASINDEIQLWWWWWYNVFWAKTFQAVAQDILISRFFIFHNFYLLVVSFGSLQSSVDLIKNKIKLWTSMNVLVIRNVFDCFLVHVQLWVWGKLFCLVNHECARVHVVLQYRAQFSYMNYAPVQPNFEKCNLIFMSSCTKCKLKKFKFVSNSWHSHQRSGF